MLSLTILAQEGHKPNGIHFGADINELIWGTLGFLVILAILVKLTGPAAKKAMADRTSRIESELADARAARDAAEAALTESTSELPDVDAEAKRIRSEAAETAERLKVDLAAKAADEAASIRNRGAADVENMKRQALADLSDEVSRLTRDTTEAVVTAELDDAAHVNLIDRYIEQVGQL